MGMRHWMGREHVAFPRPARPYHRRMKTTYILAAILASSIVGAISGGRALKTTFAVASGVLALYALVRILG